MTKTAASEEAPKASGLVAGLVSVTFREHSIQDVVGFAADAGLTAIEWAGDVHVPPGDMAAAEEARTACGKRGLKVVSYGSYFRAGDTDQGEFSDVVRTATALGAPTIRVWAGSAGSAVATEEQRANVVTALRDAVDEAAAADLKVALEFHSGTLADTVKSTQSLLDDIDRSDLSAYWQPGRGTPPMLAAEQVRALLPRLSTIHAFSWARDGSREALADQEDMWTGVLSVAAGDDQPHPVLLEFVADDDPDAFRTDAQTLLDWLQNR